MKTCRKKPKRILAMFAVLAMTAGLFPVSGVTVPQAQAAEYGVSNPRIDSDGTVTWDCVYFGNYPQSGYTPAQAPENPVDGTEYTDSDGTKMVYKERKETTYDENDNAVTTDYTGYYKVEPIKWRVLSVDGDNAFLLADQNLDCQPYNTEYADTTWAACTLRSWLNGYEASQNQESIDYSGSNDNFLDNAFSSIEQEAIKTTAVVNNDNPDSGTEGGDDTSDQVYLLSIAEAENAGYGFTSSSDSTKTRGAKNTAYAKACGASTYTYSEGDWNYGNGGWWLRSPGYGSHNAAFVYSYGDVYSPGYGVSYDYDAVRPALHLNLQSTSAYQKAGTVTFEGTVNGSSSGGAEVDSGSGSPAIVTPSTNANASAGTSTNQTAVSASQTTATTSGSPADAAGKAPSAVTGVKAKAKKKSAALSWKKVSGAKGYQIQYAANKKFKSAKTKTTSKTKLTIKKLKKGKTYYFRVRAYKKSGGKTVYGKWSAVKKAKVKE